MPRYVRVLNVPVATPRVADTLAEWTDVDQLIEEQSGGASVTLETPTGAINGTNDDFVFTAAPIAVYLNQGLQYDPDDYSADGSTITFNTPPEVGDKVRGLIQL